MRVGGRPARLDGRYLEQEDFNAFASASLIHRYDTGQDPALFLVSEIDAYASRQFELDGLGVELLGMRIGPEFRRPDGLTIGPFVFGDWVRLDGASYYHSLGAGLTVGARTPAEPVSRWSIAAEALRRDFAQSVRWPSLNDRDGAVYRIDGLVETALGRGVLLQGSGGFAWQDSDAGYESHVEPNAGLRLSRRFSALVGGGAWRVSVTGRVARRGYKSPDRTIDPGTKRKDTDLSLSADLTVPLGADIFAVLRVGRTWRRSNLPNYEFDDTSVLSGVGISF